MSYLKHESESQRQGVCLHMPQCCEAVGLNGPHGAICLIHLMEGVGVGVEYSKLL